MRLGGKKLTLFEKMLKRKDYVCHLKCMRMPQEEGCHRSIPLTYFMYHSQTIANKEIPEGFVCWFVCVVLEKKTQEGPMFSRKVLY